MNELKADGHAVNPVQFEFLDYIVPAYYVLTTAEASSNLSRYDGVRYGYRTKKTVPDLTGILQTHPFGRFWKGSKTTDHAGNLCFKRRLLRCLFYQGPKGKTATCTKNERIFSDFDFILMPNSPSPAFKIGEKMDDPIAMYLADIYTVMANLVGCPAISLPLFKHSNGMPFGLQVMSKNFNELSLLQVSQYLMKANRKG